MTTDETAEQPTVAADSDETTVVPPQTEAAPELAWSRADEDDSAPGPPRSWRSTWVITGVGLLCATAVAVAIAAIGEGSQTGPEESANAPHSQLPTALPPPPTLDGTYRFEFYPARATFHGNAPAHPVDSTPTTDWWGMRSACFSDGCTALGIKLDRSDHQRVNSDHRQLTFDFVDGAWHQAVPLTYQSQCANADRSETVSMSLTIRPRPDGTLDGTETTAIETDDCGYRGNVTRIPLLATRVGDAPAAATPPSSRPAMTPTPTALLGPAQTISEQDEQFLAALADHGIPVSIFDGGAMRAAADGVGTCDGVTKMVNEGYRAADVIAAIRTTPPTGAPTMTKEQSTWFVRLSISTYCPQYEG